MLFWLELKKTLFAPVLIGFAVLCIAFNVFIVFGYDYRYNSAERESEPSNIFEGFRAIDLADYYAGIFGMTGRAEKNIRDKYAKLQPIIDEKAVSGDALSVYFGRGTYLMHDFLFRKLFFAIVAEGALIAMFAALMQTGYENIRDTEQLVCSSRVGRRISRAKLAASLTTGLVFFSAIFAVSLALFFSRYDYTAVWNDNVSSAFNYRRVPFVTWRSFTVREYMWAMISAAAGLAAVFGLFGYAVGTYIRNTFISCGVAIALCILQFMTVRLFQVGGTIRGALNLTPIMLWVNVGRLGWFTEGGEEIIFANFETSGLIACFAVLTAATITAMKSYKRRDLL